MDRATRTTGHSVSTLMQDSRKRFPVKQPEKPKDFLSEAFFKKLRKDTAFLKKAAPKNFYDF
ncbi:hypothetical protein [Komagataeibacter oboediens]|uniref:hypothetical protein n=1 Tax=Komagataeibacter oboediens TaxID=65958 RepID=UPI001C2BEC0D|nr:hypothetical protein [Komagataeibacter oboediens]MCK9819802.1 hypothetical protein [Komagataeibacter oboediens]